MRKFNCKRLVVMMIVVLAMVCLTATTAFAAGTGDVAGAVESTWTTASAQIKTVVNNVVLPAIDLCSSLPSWVPLISSIANPASLSGRLRPFCLLAWCLL